MKKLNEEEIKKINENMIVKETEKALNIKMNYIKVNGEEKEITMWIPKSCTEYTECGILKVKDWFKKNKERELHGILQPVINY